MDDEQEHTDEVAAAPPKPTVDEQITGLIGQFRNGTVHSQSDAVVRAARVIATVDDEEARKAHSARFVEFTGFPAESFLQEVIKAKSATTE